MSTKLDILKKKRSGLRTQTTKLCNKIETTLQDVSISVTDKLDVLNISKEQLDEKYENLKKLNSDIQDLITDTDFQNEIETSETYSEKIIESRYKITKFLNERNVTVLKNESNSKNINYESPMKLPKLTINKFYGDPSKWLEFWSQFSNAIEQNPNLTPIDKFSYLKSFLGGNAYNVVAGFSLTEDNFKSAVELLKNRYGRQDLVINAHMGKLLNLRQVKCASNVKELRELYDNCEIQIRNLNSLGVTAGSYGHLLCPILLKLIPTDIALDFNRKRINTETMDVEELLSFFKKEIESREAILNMQNSEYQTSVKKEKYKYNKYPSNFKREIPTASALTTNARNYCIFCNTEHDSKTCKNVSIPEKREKLRKEGRCYICYRKFHVASKCKFNSNPCSICNGRFHDSSICLNKITMQNTAPVKENNSDAIVTSVSYCNQNKSENLSKEIFLQTVCVNVESDSNSQFSLCLFDVGSERTFVTKQLVSKLNPLIIRQEKLQIFSFASVTPKTRTYDVVQLKLTHKKNKSQFIIIEALVTDIISNAMIRPPRLNKDLQVQLAPYDLSTSDEMLDSRINVLIGADYFYQICYDGEVIKITNSLFLCGNLFGFSLCGYFEEEKRKSESASVFYLSAVNSEKEDLKFLWDLESLGITHTNNDISDLDREIMNKFENNLKFVNNRYETCLLWKDEKNKVGNNFKIAKRRFDDLIRKLDKDNDLCKNYTAIVSEQEISGVVEECPDKIIENGYFMPHRPVLREDKSTTKVRMVFDASSKEKHLNSLNDCLYPGPNLNPSVLDIIINFRKHNVAFCADLEKAFLQIGITEEDRDYLKFLWFGDEKDNFKILRLTRAAFGVTCSTFILAATIKHHIRKYDMHPEVFKILDSSLYVDDLITGSKSDEEAYYLSSTASDIFKQGGMNLRKFNTNSIKLRKMWEENKLCELQENSNNSLKILGLLWDTKFDSLHFDMQSFPDDWKLNPTKRFVLKAMLKIFDPIGFIAPFSVRMKSLLQETWQRGLEWDDILPNDLKDEWEDWCSEIDYLNKFEVPRKYFPHGIEFSDTIQIHIFSDASPKAYGAVAYFRIITNDNKILTSLIWAKCRVSPIKRLTIPRLELMGAVIAARMSKYLKILFNFPNLDIYIWSDSTITLYWIKGSPLQWKPFVSNRVTEIQSLTCPKIWNYTPGKDNPSDLLTRGEKLNNLTRNKIWFYGPEWLSMSDDMWPKPENMIFNENVLNEKRPNMSSAQLSCAVNVLPESLLKLENYSNLSKVFNITAWIMRFFNNIDKRKSKISGPLTASEIEKAEIYWIKQTQISAFAQEIDLLKREKSIHKDSSLYSLNPKLDENNLLIISGRLQFSEFSVREKHPWILPNGGNFLNLLIKYAHEKVFHFGITSTLAHLREKYYIIKGRKCVKSVLKNCIICKKVKASPGKQDIAPLPRDRITEAPPFITCGVDFAGPIYIKTKTGSEKAYIVLFTCAVTRAIHLEVASDLSTETFILALKRFISRRGICKTIYSDNAKTFIKADYVLKEIWSRISKPEVQEYFSSNNITWKFIIPRASWWGGFWERMVRSVKTPLKKILGRSCLTYEEIQTVLTEIEAVINGRPLTFVYEENSEPQPLTPSHFLIGKRINSLPDVQYSTEHKSDKKTLTKILRYREQIIRHFWKRWRKEYLLELRSANFTTPVNAPSKFKVGDVVMIHEDKIPKHLWKCGVIKELFCGRDNKVRSCALQTSNGVIKRPIQLLYKLELDIHE